MRIRFLAAAAVTTGALMTVLTGAAGASGTPAPAESSASSGLAVPAVPAAPPEGAVTIACRGGKGFVTRALTEAERERLRAEGRRRAGDGEVVPAVPALPALPADGPSEVRVAERGETVHPEGWDEVRVPGEATRGKRPHGKPYCVKAFPGRGSCEVVKGRAVPVPRHGSSGSSGSFHSSGPEDVVRVRKLPGKPAVVCVSERR
ncbi:hypothetical protein [Planomonospora parontospora]|uniref:hypothetical protein n=1 Tax=Planomonospora parontospora TaxID=58119 RepID=UPI0016704F65|nr:hypothetical protein [Planomonospora parontospora]GGL34038.1 hypothetical protein GCM10014719_39010 [Planomonospora parontospora subsp. antibiotica]GII17106.1 hypothetical protein Ppa05_38320 [Planomonospora parontospora subsp. antibiotica]